MKINELRIGNLVSYNNMYKKIIGITQYNTIILEKQSIDISDITPINLTEEILLKCGFEKKDYGEYWSDDHIDINYDYQLCTYTQDYVDYPINYAVPLKYLHQLQNLYFSLTEIELHINF